MLSMAEVLFGRLYNVQQNNALVQAIALVMMKLSSHVPSIVCATTSVTAVNVLPIVLSLLVAPFLASGLFWRDSSVASPKGSPIDFRSSRVESIDRALRDPRSTFDRSSPKGSPIDFRSSRVESIDRSSPKGSPIDRVDRALRDPRSIETIEPSGIPDRALRDPRSIEP